MIPGGVVVVVVVDDGGVLVMVRGSRAQVSLFARGLSCSEFERVASFSGLSSQHRPPCAARCCAQPAASRSGLWLERMNRRE